MVRSSSGYMVNENMSLGQSKMIEKTKGNIIHQKHAQTKASKGQTPQLLDVSDLCPPSSLHASDGLCYLLFAQSVLTVRDFYSH